MGANEVSIVFPIFLAYKSLRDLDFRRLRDLKPPIVGTRTAPENENLLK